MSNNYENFKANIIEENDRMFVFEWKNKDGSIFYSSTFYLDKVSGTLMIVSDMGTCIARWYNPVTEREMCRLVKDIAYFRSKIKAIDLMFFKNETTIAEDMDNAYKKYVEKYGEGYDDDTLEDILNDFEWMKERLIYADPLFDTELEDMWGEYHLNEFIDGLPGERYNPAIELWSDGYIRAMKQLGRLGGD